METLNAELKKERIPYKIFGGWKHIKRHIRFLNHILHTLDNEGF